MRPLTRPSIDRRVHTKRASPMRSQLTSARHYRTADWLARGAACNHRRKLRPKETEETKGAVYGQREHDWPAGMSQNGRAAAEQSPTSKGGEGNVAAEQMRQPSLE